MRRVAFLTVCAVAAIALHGAFDETSVPPTTTPGTASRTAESNPSEQTMHLARETAATKTPATDEHKPSPPRYESITLPDDHVKRIKQSLDRRLRMARSGLLGLDRLSDPVEQAARIAEQQAMIRKLEAAIPLFAEGSYIATRHYRPDLKSDDDCYYWNTRYPHMGILYFPIPLDRFPSVAIAHKHKEEMRRFWKTDRGFKWNSLPYEERRRLVTKTSELNEIVANTNAEWEALTAIPIAARSPAQSARIEEIQTARTLSTSAMAKLIAGPLLDPDTLEWSPRD